MADIAITHNQQQNVAGRLAVLGHDLEMALIIARREIRDSFRDWRIIIPILLLTLFFPALMNFTAGRLFNFVTDYGAEIIANQLIPFLLLVVGFFPTSFSLVIALETFVGEKERKSLEPLLATPLTNTQLYLGKMMAAVVPPLFASFLGILVYLVGLTLTVDWQPTWSLFIQTILLTTVQGVVMVAGAVIVSSQTTSVRAANLLASFIIVPMALLIQFEAVAMFWGNHVGLWWLILALTITALILIRMGIHVFNREELLGRDIDSINLGWMWRTFWNRYTGRDTTTKRYARPGTWYRQTFAIFAHLRQPFAFILIGFILSAIFGVLLARQFPFSPEAQAQLQNTNIAENLANFQSFLFILPLFIFLQNIRVVALATLLGMFSFGVAGFLIFMLPWGFIAFLATQFALAGENPITFLVATILPHATVEMPTLLIAAAASLRWHVSIIALPPNKTISQVWLEAAADFSRLFFGLIAPLLLLSALIEAFITPQITFLLYGG